MKPIVERNCTVVPRRGDDEPNESRSDLLRAFRSEPAYVLLGGPGSGKTTALMCEFEEMDGSALFLDARDFLALDLDQHPEWRGKTLFIDGLDEVRAGAPDARTPLDEMRRRLDALGRPNFRLACREADWLGENDRSRLEVVAPSGEVVTLRLDPLTDADVDEILGSHPEVGDVDTFREQAREREVEALLSNPQTLVLLVEVVGTGSGWPHSRLETFELACRQMATEHNEEHARAEPFPPPEGLLDAAGYLCVTQLVTGAPGNSLRTGDSSTGYIPLADCEYVDPAALRHALGTRLFRSPGEGRLTPIHRHVAEFLGTRHLAGRIGEGLPTRRVLALISGSDGVVVTEMRGLSGWLAAHSAEARDLLVESDPLGAALYGDLRHFAADEKRRLLRALGRSEVMNLLERQASWSEVAAAFGPLVSADMEPAIGDLLSGRGRSPEDERLAALVLALLGHAPPLPGLTSKLLTLVRGGAWPPRASESALDALLHSTSENEEPQHDFPGILKKIRMGSIVDPDDRMRGTLLARLYPRTIGPAMVWEYLDEPKNPNLIGRYWRFWDHDLLHKSSDREIAELLDHLPEREPEAFFGRASRRETSLRLRLLARGLELHGDTLETPRLYRWLTSAAVPVWHSVDSRTDPRGRIQRWLEERPDVQKAVILEGLRRYADRDDLHHDLELVWGALQGSTPPPGFGPWCLGRAAELAPLHPRAAEALLDMAFQELPRDGEASGLSLDSLAAGVRGHEILEKRVSELIEGEERAAERRARFAERRARDEREESRNHDEGIAYVRSHVDDLRQNRAPSALLHDLARIYFGDGRDSSADESPSTRISAAVGGDEGLVAAALAGLRGTVWRSDVPGVEEIIRLDRASRVHYLAIPFLASLDLLATKAPEQLEELSECQIQSGLAFLYFTPVFCDGLPGWHTAWTRDSPQLVADVAVRCAIASIRYGDGYSRAIEVIAGVEGDSELTHAATVEVLKHFPPRAGLSKLETLDRLLWRALGHTERSSLLDAIEARLALRSMEVSQRVRWLAAGALASPGGYTDRLDRFVRAGERRAPALAEFLRHVDSAHPLPDPEDPGRVRALRTLIGLLGRRFAPDEPADGIVTLEMTASDTLDGLVQQLGSLPGTDVSTAFDALLADPGLLHWHDRLARARDAQWALHRDASYRHPTLGELNRSLANEAPANAADLAALLVDRLRSIASTIRTSNTDDWRQYWNVDSHNRPESPRHEDSCRDALLSRLRPMLPPGVKAEREGQYAGNRRSDICVSSGGFNVPVELKKDAHRDVWGALRRQLIGQYVRGAGTFGYGVYVVLWFGQRMVQPAPRGARPATPDEMASRLREALKAEETSRITVVVIDVSPVASEDAP